MLRLLLALLVALASTRAWALPGDQLRYLVPDQPQSGQDFSDAVAISGSIVAVGAEDAVVGGVASAGAVFLFDVATGSQLRRLTPDGPPVRRQFGTSVDIDGTLVIAGSEDENNNRGAAYLFHVAGNQLFRFDAADGAAGDEFGQDAGISGEVVAVGAPSAGGLGALYLFNAVSGTPIGGTLRPSDLPLNAEFGSRLDMDGNRIVVAMDNFGLGGAAYVYDAAGSLLRKLTLPSEHADVRGFGRSVAVSGRVALIGATPSDDQTLGDRGTAFLFDVETGEFLRRLTPLDSMPDDLFGEDVALSGNLALVAARREPALGLVNAAYLFDVTTGNQLARLDGTGIVAGTEAFEAIAIDGALIVGGHEGFDSPGFANNGRAIVFDALMGDYDRDGKTDGADFLVWQRQVGQTQPGSSADGDRDVDVDADDLQYWRGNYGLAAPSGAPLGASVPEPGAFAMLATAFVLSLRRAVRALWA